MQLEVMSQGLFSGWLLCLLNITSRKIIISGNVSLSQIQYHGTLLGFYKKEIISIHVTCHFFPFLFLSDDINSTVCKMYSLRYYWQINCDYTL